MSAPAGNQFWKMRSKHGRDKIFTDPATLLEACEEYFEQTDKRVWVKTDYKGKDIERVEIPTSVPYTLMGLQLFLGVDDNTWIRYRGSSAYKAFWEVVAHVEKIIYAQKFEGAVVGAFNPNIIARDLGLVEKSEVKSETRNTITVGYGKKDLESYEDLL